MKRRKVNYGFLTLVLAIIFAILFGACGEAGGADIQGPGLGEIDIEELLERIGDLDFGDQGDLTGQTGPGGGIIFYYDPAGFTMTDINRTAHYLEAAPVNSGKLAAGWDVAEGVTRFSSGDLENLDSYIIGNGRKDTLLHIRVGNSVAELAASYSLGGRNDWFLPSCGELRKLYEYEAANDVFNYYVGELLFSSSVSEDWFSWYINFDNGSLNTAIRFGMYDPPRDSFVLTVHPIRAF